MEKQLTVPRNKKKPSNGNRILPCGKTVAEFKELQRKANDRSLPLKESAKYLIELLESYSAIIETIDE